MTMAEQLAQATAATKVVFLVDATDHVTGKTGLTLTVDASKNGGAFAAITPVVTELSYGWYALALTAGHTDTLGDLALHLTAAGADPRDVRFVVGPATPAVNVTQVAGVAATLGATLPAGAITTASFAADATVPRVTLADTVTTYTGNTPQTGDGFARLGVGGAGLTALGDARLANLDAAISTAGPTPAAVAAAVLAFVVRNGVDLQTLLGDLAAQALGDFDETADHSQTQFYDRNAPQGAEPRITSTNTATSRRVTVRVGA